MGRDTTELKNKHYITVSQYKDSTLMINGHQWITDERKWPTWTKHVGITHKASIQLHWNRETHTIKTIRSEFHRSLICHNIAIYIKF